MKKTFLKILCLFIASIFFTQTVYASGNVNADGGDGDGGGHGSNNNGWVITGPDGYIYDADGLRVYIVNATTGARVGTNAIDITNYDMEESNIWNGNGKTKNEYRFIDSTLNTIRFYEKVKIDTGETAPLPKIIPWDGPSYIEEIKEWFLTPSYADWVLGKLGFTYSEMQTGAYKLAFEPILYFRYKGYSYALTATEVALFCKLDSGLYGYDSATGVGLGSLLPLRYLPLSVFLERTEFSGSGNYTVQAWLGDKNSVVSNLQNIINYLGFGTVEYYGSGGGDDGDDTPSSDIEVGDGAGTRSYPTNTYVVTSVRLCNVAPTGNAGNPWTAGKRFALDNPANVTFNINGTYYNVSNIYIPKGGEQLVYVKWRTPAAPRNFDITVTANSGYFFNERNTGSSDRYGESITLSTTITDRNAETAPPDPRPEHTPATNGYDKTAAENARQSLMNQNQNPVSNWTVWDCEYEMLDSYPTSYTVTVGGGSVNNLTGDSSISVNPVTGNDSTGYDEESEIFTHRIFTGSNIYGESFTSGNTTYITVYQTLYFTANVYTYRFYPIYYTVELLQASYEKSAIEPSVHVPTAKQQYGKWTMKSGYGINIEVSSHIKTTINNTRTGNTTTQTYTSAASCSFAANAQTATARFPEFMYSTYYRRLEDVGGGVFGFKKNKHSTYNDRSHFTPLWYPDNTDYSVVVTSDWAYTPTGVLKLNSESNAILINGNVYDDWYVAPVKVN